MKSRLHRALLAVTAVIGAAASLSCSDSLFGTKGGGGVARIVIEPRFAERDAAIYASLVEFNLAVQTLRIVLRRPNSSDTLADTTLTVAPGQDSVLIQLQVILAQPEEILAAAMEMRSGSTLVFAGTASFTARVGPPAAAALPPVLAAAWVGPGKEATRIRITPRDMTIPASGRVAISATAFDAGNAPVANAEYEARWRWEILEPTLATFASVPGGRELVGAGSRGVVRVTVVTPNLLRDTVRITLVPPATQLVVISGGGQSGLGGSTLPQPFVVEVRAADNLPVPNTAVQFRALSGGGSVSPATATTNAQGRAQTSMTLGTGAQNQSYEAAVVGLPPVSVTATSTVGTATSIAKVAGDNQSAPAGTAVATRPAVKVTDAQGNGVGGVTVTFAVASGGGSITGATPVTGADGIASVGSWILGSSSGTNTLTATAAGLTGSPVTFSATATVLAASISFANGVEILDRATTRSAPVTAKAPDGSTVSGVPVTYTSRTTAIATVSDSGVITGVAKGQAVIVANVQGDPAIADSLLAIVAEPGGPVVLTGIQRFRYPTDTTFTVSVFVDMRTSTKKLGSTTIDVEWNAGQLQFVSSANGTGVSPTVNSSNVAAGKLALAIADVAGFSGRIELLRITFRTSAAASTGALKVTAREVNATDYTDLLPLTVHATHPLSVR